MKTYVFIAESLDGYIAKKDGNIDWLTSIENPPNEDYGFKDFINGIDAIIMGRGTFDTVVNFTPWPYIRKVFVFSKSLKQIPEHLTDKVDIINGEPRKILDSLSRKGYSNFYVDGGKTIQSFLKEDLIDEMVITRIPLLLGEGIPLFGQMNKELQFKHIESKIYSNGLVKSRYARAGR